MVKYETISGKRGPYYLKHLGKFTPNESNKVIKDLVRKIEQYEETRDMETDYSENIDNRITRAEMQSRDSVVKGVISYVPMKIMQVSGDPLGPDEITANFYFNSDNKSDLLEYEGLARIIESKPFYKKILRIFKNSW